MRILVLSVIALASCAKQAPCPEPPEPTPPGYVCGPQSAYVFPPPKGTEVKTYLPWRARTAFAFQSDESYGTFAKDDLCIIPIGTTLVVKSTGKEYVVVSAHTPPSEEGVAGGRPCPDGHLVMSVMQFALMAREAKEADDRSASETAKQARERQIREMIDPDRPR